MTHYERITNMSKNELAIFLREEGDLCIRRFINTDKCRSYADCVEHIKDWLEEET